MPRERPEGPASKPMHDVLPRPPALDDGPAPADRPVPAVDSPAAALRRWGIRALLALAIVWAWVGLGLDARDFLGAWAQVQALWELAWPLDFDHKGLLWDALVETVQIAVLATGFGFALSVPLGLLAARTITPFWIATPMRLVASAVRVLPSLLWALVAVITLGPGPLAGVVAMTFYTIGYLAKLQSEAIEGLPRDPLDAVRAMGAPKYQQAWHVVLPESANALRSQALFMFEYNVRSSSVIGFVGAGGIGMQLNTALQFFDYGRAFAIVVLLFALVIVIDGVSYLIRRRYMELGHAPRAKWRDLLRSR